MIFKSKKNKIIEFKEWVDKITEKSEYKIDIEDDVL
jgi:hypothetical protein